MFLAPLACSRSVFLLQAAACFRPLTGDGSPERFFTGKEKVGEYDRSFGGRSACGLCAATLVSDFGSVQ